MTGKMVGTAPDLCPRGSDPAPPAPNLALAGGMCGGAVAWARAPLQLAVRSDPTLPALVGPDLVGVS